MNDTSQTGRNIERVLIVEDSAIIAMDVEDCLLDLGIGEVLIAHSLESGLALLDSAGLPDWAILDFQLGDESCELIARRLETANVPFVLATGFGERLADEGGFGAFRVLTKPYKKQDLHVVVQDLRVRKA